MKKEQQSPAGNDTTQSKAQTLQDITHVRGNQHHEQDRLAAFNETATAHNYPDDVHLSFVVIHPDGITNLNIKKNEELAAALIAIYSDGHGDFGQWNITPEPTEHTQDNEDLER